VSLSEQAPLCTASLPTHIDFTYQGCQHGSNKTNFQHIWLMCTTPMPTIILTRKPAHRSKRLPCPARPLPVRDVVLDEVVDADRRRVGRARARRAAQEAAAVGIV